MLPSVVQEITGHLANFLINKVNYHETITFSYTNYEYPDWYVLFMCSLVIFLPSLIFSMILYSVKNSRDSEQAVQMQTIQKLCCSDKGITVAFHVTR